MKKRIILVVSLAICLVMLSGCTALPYLGLQSMFRGDSVRNTQSSLPEAGGELVTISREEYERYQKYNTLMEIMAIVEENYYEEQKDGNGDHGCCNSRFYRSGNGLRGGAQRSYNAWQDGRDGDGRD